MFIGHAVVDDELIFTVAVPFVEKQPAEFVDESGYRKWSYRHGFQLQQRDVHGFRHRLLFGKQCR